MAQANDLRGQERRLWWLVPTGVLGGLAGGFLLLQTEERVFRTLVPYLILLACFLLAMQGRVRAWLTKRAAEGHGTLPEGWAVVPIFAAAIYGGYFGAGLSVILLAVLGLVLDDSLTRLNALKQAVAFSVNIAAAVFFLFSGLVVWPAAIVMAIGALIGGVIGGRFAGSIKPELLRRVVVTVGVLIAIVYFVR